MQDHKGLRKSVAIVGVIASALIIATLGANFAIAKKLGKTLDAYIEESGLEEAVKYDGLFVNAIAGGVTVKGLRLGSDVDSVSGSARSVSVSLTPSEAFRFATHPESATLTHAAVRVRDVVFQDSSSESSAMADDLVISADGSFSASGGDLKAITVKSVKMCVRGGSVNAVSLGLKAGVKNLSCSVSGHFTPMILAGGFDHFLSALSYVAVHADQLEIIPSDDMKSGASAFFGSSSWLSDPDNSKIKSFDIQASSNKRLFDIKKCTIDSGLVSLSANGSLPVGTENFRDVNFVANVSEIDPDLRHTLSALFSFMGAAIPPTGAFEVSMDIDENGMPRLSVQ